VSRFTEKAKEEFLLVLPPTLFFFVALHVVALIRSLMIKGDGIGATSVVSIAVASLILGKAVLLADMLPFINRFPERPLAVIVAWKTSIYLIVSLVIHYLERLYDFARDAGGIVAGNDALHEHNVWPRFWAVQLLLFWLIMTYCAFHELGRVIGTQRMRRLFVGPLTNAPEVRPTPSA
jgi:hypothetical protein